MRDIPGWEGLYAVTSSGMVWSYHRRKFLSPRIGKRGKGYLIVGLWRDGKGKNFYVHQLVAKAYIANPEQKSTVNHKNGDVKDNRVENLEWMTIQEQQKHAWAEGLTDNRGERNGAAKLTDEQIAKIKQLCEDGSMSQREIGEMFGVNQSHVSRVFHGHARKEIQCTY